jgi:hypothetical protein
MVKSRNQYCQGMNMIHTNNKLILQHPGMLITHTDQHLVADLDHHLTANFVEPPPLWFIFMFLLAEADSKPVPLVNILASREQVMMLHICR